MTPVQYTTALKRLGLTPSSKRAAELLGIQVRQSQRYASGEQPVSEPVARLLKVLVHFKIDPAVVSEL